MYAHTPNGLYTSKKLLVLLPKRPSPFLYRAAVTEMRCMVKVSQICIYKVHEIDSNTEWLWNECCPITYTKIIINLCENQSMDVQYQNGK